MEASFEKYLRGTPGVEEVQVDSQGKVLGLLSYTPPVPGDNLVLSISLTDQRAAVQALDEWVAKARGMTRPVTSTRTISGPRLPRWWSRTPATARSWRWPPTPITTRRDFLGRHQQTPNGRTTTTRRTISPRSTGRSRPGTPPGSTWKLITATAMLRYGFRTPGTYYDDLGTYTIGGQVFKDNDNTAFG